MGFGGPHAGYMAVREKLRPQPARPAGRRLRGRRRQPGLPAGPADPRAAHPPREGHQQHLHRAGPARRHGRRCTPSTTAPTGLRTIARRTHRYAAVLAAGLRAGGVEVVHGEFFDTAHRPGPRPRRRGRRRRPRARRQPAARRRRPGLASPATRPPPARSSPPCWAAFGGSSGRRRRAGRGDRGRAARRAAAHRRPTSPTRSSTSTAPRPRCCATCAGSPTATTRWTAA